MIKSSVAIFYCEFPLNNDLNINHVYESIFKLFYAEIITMCILARAFSSMKLKNIFIYLNYN